MYQPISAQKYSADTSRLSEVYQDYDLLLCLGFSVVALIHSTAIGYRLIPFPSVDKSVKLVITNVHMGQCGSLDDDATQRPSRSAPECASAQGRTNVCGEHIRFDSAEVYFRRCYFAAKKNHPYKRLYINPYALFHCPAATSEPASSYVKGRHSNPMSSIYDEDTQVVSTEILGGG